MTYTYQPKGVCSRQMTFDIEDGVIRSVDIVGGAAATSRASPAWWRA